MHLGTSVVSFGLRCTQNSRSLLVAQTSSVSSYGKKFPVSTDVFVTDYKSRLVIVAQWTRCDVTKTDLIRLCAA